MTRSHATSKVTIPSVSQASTLLAATVKSHSHGVGKSEEQQ